MSISSNLRELRNQKEMTQGELANISGLKLLQISRIERGESEPKMNTIKKLSIALSCTSDELIFNKTERQVDDKLKFLFEGILRIPENKQRMAIEILESIIMKSDAENWIKK